MREASHQSEIDVGARFPFGENWRRFLSILDEGRIARAQSALADMLGVPNLSGKTFLDIGSGSGLSSLAAHRMNATVHSFDYDPASVACTQEVRQRYKGGDESWTVEEGSVLDESYMQKLGRFDVVYSWGVLHHTGRMWPALELVAGHVKKGGQLFIALYNDQQWLSKYWLIVKRLYNKSRMFRMALIMLHAPYLLGARFVVRCLGRRLHEERGMSLWHDMIDWLGGYPFEVASPDEVVEFLRPHGFRLERIRTCGGRHGCNQYVFRATE